MTSQPIRSPAKVWLRGGTRAGSSRLAMVTSIHSASSLPHQVRQVPQVPQKARSTFGLERKITGSPAVHRSAERRTLNHATDGAPAMRRQSAQWQTVASRASSSVA